MKRHWNPWIVFFSSYVFSVTFLKTTYICIHGHTILYTEIACYQSLPHLPKGVFVSLFNLHPPESRAEQKLYGSPPQPPSPPGLCTIETLFRSWLTAFFPTFDQGTLKSIQCPCLAKKPMGRMPLQADTKAHCARHLSPEQWPRRDYQ